MSDVAIFNVKEKPMLKQLDLITERANAICDNSTDDGACVDAGVIINAVKAIKAQFDSDEMVERVAAALVAQTAITQDSPGYAACLEGAKSDAKAALAAVKGEV